MSDRVTLRGRAVAQRRRLIAIAAPAAALGTALAVASWTTDPSFRAKFGPIDDHEQLIWLGPDNRLPWSQFWSTLIHKTEVGQWGGTGRFRPAYYALRVAETVVLGNDPRAWYVVVFVLFAGTCALLGYTASIWIASAATGGPSWIVRPLVVGGAAAATFLFAGLYAWSGIVGRLGPAEQLGLAAAAVVLLSLTKLSLGSGRWWWAPALIGAATATFAKESFVSLCLAFPLVGIFRYVAHGRRSVDAFAAFLGLLPAAILVGILAPTLLHSHHDVYGAGVGAGRLGHAISGLTRAPVRQPFLTGGGTLVLAWLALAATVLRTQRHVPAFLLATVGWLLACLFLDDWFYGGNYALPRYYAVPDLLFTLELVAAGCLSIGALRRSRGRSEPVAWLAIVSFAVSSYFLIHLATAARANLRLTHATASRNAAATIQYQRGLSATLARIRVKPREPVAVVATLGSDYEPAFAILNELARRTGDRYREYLIVARPKKADPLLHELIRLSTTGRRDWHTEPVGQLRRNMAVCVFLNVRPRPVRGCRRGDGVRVVARGM